MNRRRVITPPCRRRYMWSDWCWAQVGSGVGLDFGYDPESSDLRLTLHRRSR